MAIRVPSCVAAAEVDIRIGVVAARTGVAHGVADPGLAAGVDRAGSVRSCCPPCGLSSREWVIPRDDSPIAGCWLDIHVRSSAVTRPVASRYRLAGIWISGAMSREPCSRARRLGAEPWGASCSCGRSSDRSRIVICGCVMLVTRAGRLCIFGRFRWRGRAVARARGCRRDGGDCTHSQEDAAVAAAKTSGQVVSSMPVEPWNGKGPDREHAGQGLFRCALGRIRTCGLLLRRQTLYPLSYEGGIDLERCGRSGGAKRIASSGVCQKVCRAGGFRFRPARHTRSVQR